MTALLILAPAFLWTCACVFHAFEDARAEARDNAHHGWDNARVVTMLTLTLGLAYATVHLGQGLTYAAAVVTLYVPVRWFVFDALLNHLRRRPVPYVATYQAGNASDASEIVGALLIALRLARVDRLPYRGETRDRTMWVLGWPAWLLKGLALATGLVLLLGTASPA